MKSENSILKIWPQCRSLFSRWRLVCLFLFVINGISLPAFSSDLTVEGSIDETPIELKKLAARAAALESRIKEVEQRLAESHQQLLGHPGQKTVEYRLEMKPAQPTTGTSVKNVAISHLRLAINGRPFVYTQSAVVIANHAPIPLFLGRLNEGNYLVKIQFQAAVIDSRILNSSIAPWQTVDKTINLEVTAEGGLRQSQILEITENSDKLGIQIRKASRADAVKIDSQSMEKM